LRKRKEHINTRNSKRLKRGEIKLERESEEIKGRKSSFEKFNLLIFEIYFIIR
jgi:hypothetical protein